MSISARLDELRKKFDENPRRYFAPLANELRKQGDLTQAISICRTHLPNQPGHLSGHIVLAQTLYESRELAEARQIFEAAIDLDPENLIALRYLGDIAREQGATGAARSWYERVLEADPRNEEIAGLLNGLPETRSADPTQPPVEDHIPSAPPVTAEFSGTESAPKWGAEVETAAAAPPSSPSDNVRFGDDETEGYATAYAPEASQVHDEPTVVEPLTARFSAESEPIDPADDIASEDFSTDFSFAHTPVEPHAAYSAPPGDPEAAPDPDFDDWFAQESDAPRHEPAEATTAPSEFFPDLDHKDLPAVRSPLSVEALFDEGTSERDPAQDHESAPVDQEPQHESVAESEYQGHDHDAAPTGDDPAAEILPDAPAEAPEVQGDSEQHYTWQAPETGHGAFSGFDITTPHEPADEALASSGGASESQSTETEGAGGMAWEAALSPGQLEESIGVSGGWDAIEGDSGNDQEASPPPSWANSDVEPDSGGKWESAPAPGESESWSAGPAAEEHSLADPILGRTPDLDDPAEQSSAPFVTETMAELYLQQGFTDEALSIYRQLLARHPDDQTLRDRIASLEPASIDGSGPQQESEATGLPTAEQSSWSADEDWTAGAPAAPAPTPAEPTPSVSSEPTVREFFGRFARRGSGYRSNDSGNAADGSGVSGNSDAVEPYQRIGGAASSSEALTQPDANVTSLADLFAAGGVAPADEQAAADLASAFTASTREIAAATPADDLSLHTLFGDVPAHSGGAVTPPGSTYSSPTVHASEPRLAGAERAPRSDSDIEQFTAWLEGLKKK